MSGHGKHPKDFDGVHGSRHNIELYTQETVDSLRVVLLRTETCTDNNNYSFIVFVFQLDLTLKCRNTSRNLKWQIRRRYNDFSNLHSRIADECSLYITEKLPTLPGKKLFGSSTDPDFVKKRGSELRTYLQEVRSDTCM